MNSPKEHFDTLAVHAGRPTGEADVIPPLRLSTTFERGADGGYKGGYQYGRHGNPNRTTLEKRVAALEGGAGAAAFASGTAATLAVFQCLPRGSHILATRGAYYGTVYQLNEAVSGWGHDVEIVTTTDLDAVRRALRDNTSLLWLETPNNPLLEVSDIAGCATLCHERGVLLACDNTAASPVCQRPLTHGADLVMHSSTKYLGGHSDVIGGIVVSARDDDFLARLHNWQSIGGAVPSPFDCWLLARSIMSLPCRLRTQMDNAARIAEFLVAHPAVSAVHYPGLADHPGHAVARRQMRGFGALLSFQIGAGEVAARQVCRRVSLFIEATSLGGVESLIEHRASIEGPGTPTPSDLVRLSIGVEHADDLIADLTSALSGL